MKRLVARMKLAGDRSMIRGPCVWVMLLPSPLERVRRQTFEGEKCVAIGVVDSIVETEMMDKERTVRWDSTSVRILSSGSHLGLRFQQTHVKAISCTTGIRSWTTQVRLELSLPSAIQRLGMLPRGVPPESCIQMCSGSA